MALFAKIHVFLAISSRPTRKYIVTGELSVTFSISSNSTWSFISSSPSWVGVDKIMLWKDPNAQPTWWAQTGLKIDHDTTFFELSIGCGVSFTLLKSPVQTTKS